LLEIPDQNLLKKKLLIRGYWVQTNIHPFVTGAKFETIWKNRVHATFGRTRVPFASLKDLIRMKRAAGRAKDLEDLKFLLALKK